MSDPVPATEKRAHVIYPQPVKSTLRLTGLFNCLHALNKIVALECTSFSHKCCDFYACLCCNAASKSPNVFLQALQASQR